MATNEQQIAQAFVQHYFHPLNQKDKGQLAMLYTERSLLTFEGESFAGRDAIMTKLKSIPFQTRIVTVDAQPAEGGAVMVFVTGNAMPEGGEKPLNFCQTFNLTHLNNSYVIANDMFRLNYG